MIFNSTLKQIYIHFQTQGRDFVNFVFSFKKHILTIITITPSPLQLLPPSVSLFHLSPSSSPLFYLYYCHRSYYCCHHRLHYYYCHHYNRDHSHCNYHYCHNCNRDHSHCNISKESHQNQMDLETIQIWDCTVEDDLKKLINITYTNKIYLLFGSISLKNSTVKCVWLWVVME